MAVRVKNQKITEDYAIYNGDCIEVLGGVKDSSVGFSVFSPPFSDLYSYSDSNEDMGNCASYEDFFVHFGFLVEQLKRVMKPGRLVAVHCIEIPTFKRNGQEIGIRDFPGDIVRSFTEYGFIYHSRFVIWKDPLIAAVRTKSIGLAHKQLVKDSSICRTGLPDYVVVFRKPGENDTPVSNPGGLTEYHGSRSVPNTLDRFIGYEGDQKSNKRSHWIWQQYASPVWFDIRQTRVLPYRQAREEDDQKHICPLALDVIERCLALWSTKGDVVLSPFMGIGSEIYCAVRNGRKGLGIELKESYYRQAVKNVDVASKRNRGFVSDKEEHMTNPDQE